MALPSEEPSAFAPAWRSMAPCGEVVPMPTWPPTYERSDVPLRAHGPSENCDAGAGGPERELEVLRCGHGDPGVLEQSLVREGCSQRRLGGGRKGGGGECRAGKQRAECGDGPHG